MSNAVIFDIGNVLVDFNFEDLKQTIADASGRPVSEPTEEDVRMYFAAETGKISEQEYIDSLNEARGLNWTIEDLTKVWMDMFTINETGYGLFRELIDRGLPVYTLSNIADHHIRAINANWPGFFDGATGLFLSYQIGFRKPEAGIYQHALKQIGVAPADCFFMDDLRENIDAACAQGIQAHQYIPQAYEGVRGELERFLA